jgi:hypothetical protein
MIGSSSRKCVRAEKRNHHFDSQERLATKEM